MITHCDQARNLRAVVDKADAQGSDAIPTPYDRLRWAADEISGQLDMRKREGVNAQQKELEEVLQAIWLQKI